MARTWSAPQRGSIALTGAEKAPRQGWLSELIETKRIEPERGSLLLLAAVLTLAGILVPHVPAETLSTLLFLAGAGLAGLLILLTGRQTSPAATSALSRSSHACAQKRFAELAARHTASGTLDRAAWAKLTSHMSHELRTPLNAVLGFSELMSNEVFGPLGSDCYSAYARDIHTSGRMLLKSAEDALAITAVLTAPTRRGLPATTSLAAAIEEACAFSASDLAARAVTIETDIDTDLDVIADPQATRQLLINLLAVALRGARDGAALRLATDTGNSAVRLSLALSAADAAVAESSEEEAFPMILARTLCELLGAILTTSEGRDGSRRWTVSFARAAQKDLFAWKS